MGEATAVRTTGAAPQLQDLLYEQQGGVAILTLNRPDRLNAWTGAMGQSLKAAMAHAVADDSVRAIVLTGAGRGFCAGADMNLLQGIKPDGQGAGSTKVAAADWATEFGPDVKEHFQGDFGYFMRTPKPVIAAINGPCAGLGLVVSLYADMRFAAASAVFTTAFSRRGLIAEHGVAWLLPRLVGNANALDLLLSARKVDATEAERIGLVNRTIPDAEFMATVMAYAQMLASEVSPRSMAVMKAQVFDANFSSFNESLAKADAEMKGSFASADFKEGVAHFVEKRKANFTGR
ncbi:enoyl-CoA hydratase [Zavarzinia sp. CC-PAN008]|uniref:enoyl-CoA hydratase n=1 Tax=Zavarzinia sp. CC-PAN008 TaxID=3243332 RepID=UPI003F74AC62